MDYASHFNNVLKSSEFTTFKNKWISTYGSSKSVRRHDTKEGVLIVGAGVTGLTTAIRLALHRYNVKIIAKEFVPKDSMVGFHIYCILLTL